MANYSRRDFIFKTGLIGTGALTLPMLLKGIWTSLVNRDLIGQTNDVMPMKSIHLCASGGPNFIPSFLPLTPYDTKNFVDNFIFTRFTEQNGRLQNLSYETAKVHGVNLPYIWGKPVAGSNSNFNPSDLGKNMMVIRGINMGNSAHLGAMQNRWLPPGSKVSLGGLAPTNGTSILGSLNMLDINRFPYKSEKLRVDLGSGQDLITLMQPFDEVLTGDYKNLYTDNKEQLSKILDKIILESRTLYPQMDALGGHKNKAIEIYLQGIDHYINGFNEAKQKYKQIIYDTLVLKCPGISDLPVGLPENERASVSGYSFIGNLQDDIRDNFPILGPENSNSTIGNLANICACAEIGITRSIFDSISAPIVDNWGHNNDEHGTGIVPSVYKSAQVGRVLIACIGELQNKFIEEGIWDRVAIEVSSEFPRQYSQLDGSNHGWTGGLGTVFTGKIKNPFVIGNIWDRSHKGQNSRDTDQGSWGSGSPTKIGNNEYQIRTPHYLVSIAELLEVPVSGSSTPLVQNTDQGLVPSTGVELAKIKT